METVDLKFTGERFVPLPNLLNDEIGVEHLHRYHAAIDIVRDKIVLDLASGEGFGTAVLAATAKKVYGMDIDGPSIEHARKTYGGLANAEFVQASADAVPLKDQSVDIVVSFETIEHLDEPTQKKFMQEISRVLRPDGKLIISTPDKVNYSERYQYKNQFHLKEFNRDEFYGFLKRSFRHVTEYLQGFEIVSAITGPEASEVQKVKICNWKRSTGNFSRKYLISVCSNSPIEADLNFSSVVFQVHREYLELTDRLVEMEAHILELGTWGKKLNIEINQRDELIRELQEKVEDRSAWAVRLDQERVQHEAVIQALKEQNQQVIDGLSAKMDSMLQQSQHLQEALKTQSDELNTLKQEKDQLASQLQTAEMQTKEQQLENEMLNQKLQEKENSLKEKERQLQDQQFNFTLTRQQLSEVNNRLVTILNSDGYRFLERYYSLKGKYLNENSRHYKFLKKSFNLLRNKKEIAQIPARPKDFESDASARQHTEQRIIERRSLPYFENPVVSIVIPVYNAWEMNEKCILSIMENTKDVPYEIIIGDDCSTDETKDIGKWFGNIVHIRNEKNLRFVLNCNHAARFARGRYIHFLNNDTEVKPGWLSALVHVMESDETVGLVGSKLIYPDGRLQEAGGIIWKDASGWNYGQGQNPDMPEFNYLKEADYVSGASMLVRAHLWKELGGFDTRYVPAYCEDADLAFTLRALGYKVMYQPLSEVVHYEGYSHGSDREQSAISSLKEYQVINNGKFYDKWKATLEKDHFPNAENVFWAKDRSRNRKTLLMVDHYVPQFDKDAGSRTTFQYLELFVKLGFNIKFMGENFYRHEPYTTVLQQMGIEVLYGPWYAGNWQQWFRENSEKFDYIYLNRPHISINYIDFFKLASQAKILYYGHDLHFLREQKRYELEKDPALLQQAAKWKNIEQYLFRNSDVILTPSTDEQKVIQSLNSDFNVQLMRPYIFKSVREPVTSFAPRQDLLFVGGFGHLPNVDGVLWFVKEVWPLLKKELRAIRFIIAGSNPPAAITNLAQHDIIVKGYVSDTELDALYATCRIAVIPLRYGAGVKGKTVEAMRYGLPLVTTSFGVEGLPGDYGFLKVAETPEAFAAAISDLYQDEAALQEISANSVDYIRENFSEKVAQQIITAAMASA
jgi:O-antigen biosynthesis protein